MSNSTDPSPAETAVQDAATAHPFIETPPGIPRSSRGRFLPGHSGNPNGRPRVEISSLRQRLVEEAEAVADVILDKAMDGDMKAAKLVLDRLLPPLREVAAPVRVELPDAAGPYPVAETVLRAALSGSISPDTAAQLVGIASQLCRISEVEDLKARLEGLERAVNGGKRDNSN